jgi:hypothetical protein
MPFKEITKINHIQNTLTTDKSKTLLTNEELYILSSTKKKADTLVLTCLGTCLSSHLIYNKIAFRFIHRNKIRKAADLLFVFTTTLAIMYFHNLGRGRLYDGKMKGLEKNYKYLLKNSEVNCAGRKNNVTDYIHSLSNKYLYFMTLLALRIVI